MLSGIDRSLCGPEKGRRQDLPPPLPILVGWILEVLVISGGLFVGGGLRRLIGCTGICDVEARTLEDDAYVLTDKALDMATTGRAFGKGICGDFLDNLKATALIASILVCWHY